MIKKIFSKAGEFIKDMRSELKKVTFPSGRETMGSTTVVIVFVVVVGVFLAIVDTILVRLVAQIIR